MCSQFIVRVCVYLSVRQGMYELAGRHRSVLFIHRVGAAQEAANRSFPGKKAGGDPCSSIGGNEPCGRGPDGDHCQTRGPEVGPPTGNVTFYIYITSTLRYLATTIKSNVRD